MVNVDVVLLVLALACLLAASFGAQSKVNLVAAGLSLWVLSLLV